MGRPTSPGSKFSSFSACGVKRRMRQSPLSIRMGMLTLLIRLVRSSLSCANSKLRFPNCSLTVTSSSLVDCNSSLAVSSSSLVDCSSSLLERASSLADFSSSLMASCSWIIDWRDSLVACKSWRSRASSRNCRLPVAGALPPVSGPAGTRTGVSWNNTRKKRSPRSLLIGTTSRQTSQRWPSRWTRMPSLRTAISCFFAW